MLPIPPDLLHAFPPSPNALLDLLRARIDDSMLLEIARADYGMDADEHLAAVRAIRDTGAVPAPMGWVPQEVLELIRWSEPGDPEWKPGSTGERGHLMRAFACAALLRAAAEPENALDGENATLAQLVASTLVLGEDAQEAAARFLVWRIPALQPEEERPFFAFALLFLAVLLRSGRLDGDALAAAGEWVMAVEEAEAQAMHPHVPTPAGPWLLRLSYFDLRHSVWRSFARRMLTEAAALPNPARETLQLIALSLTEG
jgi:hypothetical protein